MRQVRCSYCQDKKFITYDVPPGHELFGKAVPCPKCSTPAARERLRKRLLEMSRLTPEMQKWTFRAQPLTPSQKKAVRDLQRRAQNPSGFVLIYGPPGTGKTYMAAAVANEALKHEFSALYITLPELLNELRNAYGEDGHASYEKTLDLVKSADVLILDEIDKARLTDWAQEQIFHIVEHRYRETLDKLTIFITNGEPDDLPPYWRSRVLDVRLSAQHRIDGNDLRLSPRP